MRDFAAEEKLRADMIEYREKVRAAQAKGLCVQCQEPALEKCYSVMGRREYRISGFCEPCFDELFEEEDETCCPRCGQDCENNPPCMP